MNSVDDLRPLGSESRIKVQATVTVSPADDDGAVGWMDAIPFSAGHNSGNTGDAPIDLIYITMKAGAPIAPNVKHSPQAYPNISAEVLMDNDLIFAQRILIEPGQWTGAHSHPGKQAYVHVKGGVWSTRHGDKKSQTLSATKDGSVGWLDASENHDMGNTGDTTLELVLITLK